MARPRQFSQRARGLYIGRSTIFKSFLLVGIVAVSVLFIWYTFSVIDVLQRDTRNQVELYVRLWQEVANSPTSAGQLQVIFDEIILKANFPIVVANEDREPLAWRNIPDVEPGDTARATLEKVAEIAREMRRENGEYPLYVTQDVVNYFYYGESKVIGQLRAMPFIEIGIVLAFLLVGVVGFQNIKRSEERLIWVGMAKETAHQLGTPISSLMGWLEVIDPKHRQELDGDAERDLINQTVDNMQVDVSRLQRVANRFGQIGSTPELEPCDVNAIVEETVTYYRRRLPFQGQGTQLEAQCEQLPQVHLNPELFGWALENMVKNALQAVDSNGGEVLLHTEKLPDNGVRLEIKDNGRGIPAPMARKIFRPGITTKKRGWGMGLTLVKRIIEDYHGGRVQLVRSKPGETVFEILLPVGTGKKGT